jgi:glycosyltransferase involved in cell wall biosynthesis
LKLSIIIPAFNEERLIEATLAGVNAAKRAFSERGWETELIVCDNNSTDRTAELARKAGAKVVFEPMNQIGRARNSGAAAALGDWLLFIDADSIPSCELFGEMAEVIESGRCLAGGATLDFADREKYPVAARITGIWNWISRQCAWMAGSCIFCDAAAFREVGGFSKELYASEEIDLSRRLKRLARERRKKIVILHRYPLTTSARKLHLYTLREHLTFMTKAALRPGKVLTSREKCHTWYDGRR